LGVVLCTTGTDSLRKDLKFNRMDEIHEVTGMKLAELRDVTTERKQWRRLAMTVAIVPGTDGKR